MKPWHIQPMGQDRADGSLPMRTIKAKASTSRVS
jgi:hypothetical protein